MQNKGIFITATDTDAGKTVVVSALVNLFLSKGADVVPYKPIQSGYDSDINKVVEANNMNIVKTELCSYLLKKPCSPHLASSFEDISISIDKIVCDYQSLAEKHDLVVIEGSGGLMVPLGNGKYVLDIIKELPVPVMLVIANRLGAINQAMLSIDKLQQAGCSPEWLVFNDIQPGDDMILSDNVKIVSELSGISNTVRVPYMEKLDIDDVAKVLSIFPAFGGEDRRNQSSGAK